MNLRKNTKQALRIYVSYKKNKKGKKEVTIRIAMFYGTKCWVIIFHYIYQNVCNWKEKINIDKWKIYRKIRFEMGNSLKWVASIDEKISKSHLR